LVFWHQKKGGGCGLRSTGIGRRKKSLRHVGDKRGAVGLPGEKRENLEQE